jgi:hypothetical protein
MLILYCHVPSLEVCHCFPLLSCLRSVCQSAMLNNQQYIKRRSRDEKPRYMLTDRSSLLRALGLPCPMLGYRDGSPECQVPQGQDNVVLITNLGHRDRGGRPYGTALLYSYQYLDIHVPTSIWLFAFSNKLAIRHIYTRHVG